MLPNSWEVQLNNHINLLRYQIEKIGEEAGLPGTDDTQRKYLDVQRRALLNAVEHYQTAIELEKAVAKDI